MSPLSPHTADSIAGYTLIERIGAGGYGEVWKAEAPGGLAKAVKLVYGYLDDQRAACERKALARIKEARHPFLLSLERIEVVDGQLVVVTELADKSLKDRFDECRGEGLPGIPRDELLVYMGDAADALDYMRACHGLQHLDVKPENLLITSGRVKVADFGLVKSLQDDDRSLLAGLTPQYAPPELFDGSPSVASDQYSLAIVYQEMLTGIPPFPGRTAAQLASQHLHSQPRLTGLAPHDRSALTRALAKDPAQRFACCHDLVDALRGAEALALSATPANVPHDDPTRTGSSDTNSLADKDTHVPRKPQAPLPASTPAVGSRTLVIDQDAPALSDSQPAPMPLELPPATDPVRLPPVAVSTGQWTPMPCLVLGIGGTAADVLRGLRKRILRDEESFRQENLEFLLLDTDATTIDSACDDRCEDSLEFRETFHIPLRSSTDYREQSTDHLQWLSRRWLYNIPRSLRTEGRRPLGRLAFADHRSQVRKRIADALVATAEKIGLGETDEAARSPGKRLRVVLVSSICGGSGSGIVPDIGYLVRQVMDEMGLPTQEICAVLTHGTNSNHDQQDLAIANTYACLSELNHYAERGYPGDPSCGLVSNPQPAFDHTYLVHLGDELAAPAYSAAVTQVAEYLYLNFASPAGKFFDTVRTDLSQDRSDSDPGTLRTFGLIQFDPHHNEVTSLATEELSRCVVARWLGGERFFDERSVETYLEDEFPELKEAEGGGKRRCRKKPAGPAGTEHKTGLQYLLEPDALHRVLTLAVEQQLGGGGPRVFQNWIHQGLNRGLGEKRAFLKDLSRSLAPRRNVGEATDEPLSELEQSLADASAKLAVMAVESIREVLARLVANPDARIVGAQKAAQWLCDRLRQFERATTTEWTRVSDRLTALEKLLPDRVSAGGGFWGRKRSRGETWIDYCQLRSHIVVIESIARFVRRVNTHLSDYREQLKNSQFSLSRVASQFGSQQDWLNAIETSQSEETETRALSQTIGKLIQLRMVELVDQLDRAVGGELIRLESTPAGDREPPNVQRMARNVRVKSWAVLTRALHELDLPSRMFTGDGDSVRQIRDFLPNALPRLPRSGGGERLLAVFPKSTDEETVRRGLKTLRRGAILARPGGRERTCPLL